MWIIVVDFRSPQLPSERVDIEVVTKHYIKPAPVKAMLATWIAVLLVTAGKLSFTCQDMCSDLTVTNSHSYLIPTVGLSLTSIEAAHFNHADDSLPSNPNIYAGDGQIIVDGVASQASKMSTISRLYALRAISL